MLASTRAISRGQENTAFYLSYYMPTLQRVAPIVIERRHKTVRSEQVINIDTLFIIYLLYIVWISTDGACIKQTDAMQQPAV